MGGSSDSTVELAQARVGTTLRGKWRLDRLLGVGGMAAVYAGTHRNGARGAIEQ
jgi:serine/threonine-protein kinase